MTSQTTMTSLRTAAAAQKTTNGSNAENFSVLTVPPDVNVLTVPSDVMGYTHLSEDRGMLTDFPSPDSIKQQNCVEEKSHCSQKRMPPRGLRMLKPKCCATSSKA